MPILKTINGALQNEDVLGHCLNFEVSRNDGTIGKFHDNFFF